MIKLGRCSEELKRIYDIKQGRPSSEKNTNNVRNFTQKDIADSAGVSVRVLQNAERLAKLPEDIQQMVLDGVVTPSVASRVIAKLSPEEQAQLAEQISGKEKVTGSEVQQYIDELKAAREENAKLRTAISEQGARSYR